MLPNRNIKAYIARMKNASLPEMVYRMNQALMVKRMKGNLRVCKRLVPASLFDESGISNLQIPSFVMGADEAVIEAILKGRMFVLNGVQEAIERYEATHRGNYFDDIRLTPETPDIRMVWEPARLQHLTILLIHVHQNPRLQVIAAIKSFARAAILSWIRQNPFLRGPHYMSPMECGLRMPVFFYALAILDDLSPGERREILEALYQHAWWVSRNLSLYSSLGNHTICECVGLVFAGAVFRRAGEGRKWLDSGIRLLRKEALRQFLDDGGPIEQSLAYQRFVLDLFWLTIDFLERNVLEDFAELKERLSRAESFLCAFRDERGSIPAIGDSDDGHAVAPGVTPKRELKDDGRGPVITFSDGGYTVIRTSAGGLLVFDHGPLGMAPLYNHGHADALSVTLSKEGRGLLVDPGTYQYNGVQIWRRYFKSTRAHNTVTVDGQDQADQETGFIWSRPYDVRVIRDERPDGGFLIGAEHNGYARLNRPVLHRREIFQPGNSFFLIHDRFEGRGFHEFELNWHLHPCANVTKEDEWWRIENGGCEMLMKLMAGGDFDLLRGETDPVKGWYSPNYGIKEVCSVLTRTVNGLAEETEFITVICIGLRIEEKRIVGAVNSMRTKRSSL